MGLFELVDVLGDSWIILPPTQHVDGESDDVRSFKAGHVGGKMIQHVSEGHVIVEVGCTLQREQPCVLDDAEEEETAVAFDGLDEALELLTSHPIAFGTGSRGVGGISGDGRIIGAAGTSINCRRFVMASRRAFTSSSVGWPVMTVEVAARSLKRDLASSGIVMVMAAGEEVKKLTTYVKEHHVDGKRYVINLC